MFFFVISFRDAKLVYGCDIEERKRSKRRAHKRHFSEMAVATSSASFNDLDFQLAKLRLRRTKVWCLKCLSFVMLVCSFLPMGHVIASNNFQSVSSIFMVMA
jgi:hypothetical protein